MPRPAGVRNHDFDEKRTALLGALTDFALNSAFARPSLRQFALAAHQSEPTLRHYFHNRQGLVIEIISELAVRASVNWKIVSTPAQSQAEAITDFLAYSNGTVIQDRFTRAHAFGLIEGTADSVVGQAYLEMMLEPTIQAFSTKLKTSPGAPDNEHLLRASTLAAAAPVLILGIHQFLLGGRITMPIDIDQTLAHLRDLLVKAFEPAAAHVESQEK